MLDEKLPDAAATLDVLLEARGAAEKSGEPLILADQDSWGVPGDLAGQGRLARAGPAAEEVQYPGTGALFRSHVSPARTIWSGSPNGPESPAGFAGSMLHEG
jgi:hypothetical protein